MKATAKIMEFIGIVLLFIGGGAMDSASMVVPMVMAFVGMGIAFAGAALDEQLT